MSTKVLVASSHMMGGAPQSGSASKRSLAYLMACATHLQHKLPAEVLQKSDKKFQVTVLQVFISDCPLIAPFSVYKAFLGEQISIPNYFDVSMRHVNSCLVSCLLSIANKGANKTAHCADPVTKTKASLLHVMRAYLYDGVLRERQVGARQAGHDISNGERRGRGGGRALRQHLLQQHVQRRHVARRHRSRARGRL